MNIFAIYIDTEIYQWYYREMLERLREKKSKEAASQPWLEQEGVFENLIRDGRIPSFWDAGKRTIVVFPPQGAKPGDVCELNCGAEMEFFSPNGGPSKGMASLYEVSNQTAIRLKDIQNKILEEINLQTS